jgi:hypothetical protein
MREVGFEPTAKSLKGSCSTTELLPQGGPEYTPQTAASANPVVTQFATLKARKAGAHMV